MNKRNLILEKNERNISLEVLRVFCMFLIVFGHGFVHGKVMENVPLFSGNYFVVNTLYSLFIVHVNCFVLISGYFQCQKKPSLEKALALWGAVFFWSVVCYAFFVIIGQTAFSLTGLIKAFMPFTQQRYWFVTTYLLMYVLSPFVNALIDAMDQRTHALFLVVYFLIYTMLQNIIFWREYTAVNSRDPLFFISLYMTAAYIRKYPLKMKLPWGTIYLVLCMFAAGAKFLLFWITPPLFGKPMWTDIFSGYTSVPVYLGSVALFMVFLNWKVTSEKVASAVTWLAPLTFGIYLIHDNPETRIFIWQTLLKPSRFVDSPILVLYAVGCATVVFVGSGMLEYLRMRACRALGIRRLANCVGNLMKNICEKTLSAMFSM